MASIAQTCTRPAHDGRLIAEITIEGGALHVYEIDGEPFYRSLAEVLKAPTSRRISELPPNEAPRSSFDPVRAEIEGNAS